MNGKCNIYLTHMLWTDYASNTNVTETTSHMSTDKEQIINFSYYHFIAVFRIVNFVFFFIGLMSITIFYRFNQFTNYGEKTIEDFDEFNIQGSWKRNRPKI